MLEGDFGTPRARALRWRQLIDLVAQSGDALPEVVTSRALRAIALLSVEIPPEAQTAQAAAVAQRCHFAPLLLLLAGQSPAAMQAVMATARLADDRWMDVIPHLSPLGRSVLRQRDDLSGQVRAALQFFAAGDLTLTHESLAAGEQISHHGAADIRDLVRRIEAYRQNQQAAQQDVIHEPERGPVAFRTDRNGRIIDTDAANRGRIVGIELGHPAAPLESGCDAGTARIVAKRGNIAAGRLFIQGQDDWGGIWLCEAVPQFAPETGVFAGYAGSLRRPLPHEATMSGPPSSADQEDSGPSSVMLRQLMHELRSPLNAISGFAQLIEGQYAGPVSSGYRDAARTIVHEAARLGDMVDEIDLLARLSGDEHIGDPVALSVTALAAAIIDQLRAEVPDLSITMVDGAAMGDVRAAVPPAQLRRLLYLWLRSATRVRAESAALALQVTTGPGAPAPVTLTLRPESTDHVLPSDSTGFAFPAAAELAAACGGSLTAEPGQHILNIPQLEHYDAVGALVG